MSASSIHDWKGLPIKDRLAYTMAIIALAVGFGLTIAGFCVEPVGEISNSLLWILGQSLTFAGAIFGVALYTKEQISQQLSSLVTSNADKRELSYDDSDLYPYDK